MSPQLSLLAAVLLLLGNGFFVGAEFAVLSARRSQIEPLAETSARARSALTAMEHVSLMLATCQLGVTLCSLGLGAVAEPALAHLLEPLFHAVHLPEVLIHPVALVIALAAVTYLHVVVGEMIPKNLSIAGPDRAVLVLAPPLVAVGRVIGPLIRALNGLTNAALRALGVEPKDEVSSAFTVEEVQSIVAESQREGTLDDTGGLVTGALEFSDRSVGDIAVALEDLRTLPVGATPADVEALVARTGYSRFPVLDAAGELEGYLHLKDILYADDDRYHEPVPDKRIRQLGTLGEAEEVEDALAAMRRTGAHLARVVDDRGRVTGVVFLEDVIEELVGEVSDAMQRART
ncbi:hemolysin family protein [Kineococcus sp. SYSU DK006]|uniref:hemolysin family protein n=1 Tax=Kineococcus sp. SYSU DK006 TaxID=3383127 RepID=UPI003D7E06BA